ncbi:MAG: GAF domain-containing protein [Chloroflexi bacterium]|uniref:GAF domain-containing protein n=1 Tax=Candidatus Flexifilum breve TaxID=3140694 RepID=UPI0031346674|nr:GAF domain-containing protein [Chloroflexota bacterium]
MIAAINRYLNVRYRYENPIVQQRALNLLRMSAALIFVDGLYIIIVLLLALFNRQALAGQTIVDPLNVGIVVLSVVVYLLIQRGRLQSAIHLFVTSLALVIVPALATIPSAVIYVTTPIVMLAAGLLLGRRGFVATLVVITIGLLVRYANLSQVTDAQRYIPAQEISYELLIVGMSYTIMNLFVFSFSGVAERVAAEASREVEQLNTVSHFASGLGAVLTDTAIYTRLLEITQNNLGYEVAQIYLPDESGSFARQLRLSFGAAPRKVVLTESDLSVLTEAIRTRQPVVVNSSDTSFRALHLIPPARQSCTLVIIEQDTVVALLDIQTSRPRPFSRNELLVLRSLVDQASRELDYSSTIRDLQTTVRDQDGVINRFTRQLNEIQGRGRQASMSGWDTLFNARMTEAFGFDLVGEGGKLTPIRSDALPDAIRETLLRGDVHIQQTGGDQVVTVPIVFRDVVLGAMSFNVPRERPVTDRQIELIRTVADRLSVALENNRLLEQTQAQARRERQASEIGSVLLSATNVESVLSLAADNFHEALGAIHTRVYLQPGTLIKSGDAN